MAGQQGQAGPGSTGGRSVGCGTIALGVLAWIGAMVALLLATAASPAARPAVTQAPVPSGAGSYLFAQARPAPAIDLVDPEDQPFSLASLRGREVLVFFGYTHCPDVCPATMGILGQVLKDVGDGTQAVFVSIDPERDTPAWLRDYARYIPSGITPVTGTTQQIAATAAAWGVRYAKVQATSPGDYSMTHTADVFLVDPSGQLCAKFPFGTQADAIETVVRDVRATSAAEGAASAAPGSPGAASASPAPPAPAASLGAGAIRPRVLSTSVWAGAQTPVILALEDATGPIDDTAATVTVQVRGADGGAVGPPTAAVAVKPPGMDRVSYVATLGIPEPGTWRLDVTVVRAGSARNGSVDITALDPGGTPAIGRQAPTIHTPTVTDAGGVVKAVTTDPAPDLRLSQRSTTDALAAHQPFVLVVDSTRFRVTPVCGKALVMVKYLVDRWPDVAFVHLEPFAYTVVEDTPVLSSDIADPTLSPVADGWGVGSAPWGATSMPWVFVVDGNGIVRAKYQGLMGSDDVDVMLALITGDH